MRNKTNRAIAAATAAVIGLSAIAVTPASAASSPRKEVQTARDGATDISARRRHRGNNAAVVGAAAAIFGTIATIAAANARERHYRDQYYGGYRPYYAPRAYGPYAYEPYPYYGPRW